MFISLFWPPIYELLVRSGSELYNKCHTYCSSCQLIGVDGGFKPNQELRIEIELLMMSVDMCVYHLQNVHAAHEYDHEITLAPCLVDEVPQLRCSDITHLLRQCRIHFIFAGACLKILKHV